MARRIARDCIVQIALGGFDDGSTVTWGTDTTITGHAQSVSIQQSGDTVNLAGLGETDARVRLGGPRRQTISIEGFVIANTFTFYVSGTTSPVGYRARVKIKPDSTLTTAYEYTGIIREWRWNTQTGDRQVEQIEIEGPLDV